MNWRKWLCEPYGNGPMVNRRWTLSKWLEMSDLIKPFLNDQNRLEMNELKWIERFEMTWNNPMGMVLWSVESVPMEVTGMNPMRKSLSKWSESMRFEWIEVNRVNRGEMSEWMEMTWNNPMRKSLWVGWECPYGSDLRWVIWSNPIKMNGFIEKWMNRGE